MKLYSAQQFQEWDRFTILHEPIQSIDLMERAAASCAEWMRRKDWHKKEYFIFCGKGNNGGDGLAISRILIHAGASVTIFILEEGQLGTPDFQENLHRLHPLTFNIHYLQSPSYFPYIPETAIVIDALFGTGLNRPLQGLTAQLVEHLNQSKAVTVSIDLPSGMLADQSSRGNSIIKATYTLSFERLKKCFLFAENADNFGIVEVLPIGLHPDFHKTSSSSASLLQQDDIRSTLKNRKRFSHKGNYGHLLLIAGSAGKMGAAVMSTQAALKSGAGLVTVYTPSCGRSVIPVAAPEAMTTFDSNESILTEIPPDREGYQCIGIGPGIGTAASTLQMLESLIIKAVCPMVLDADAINLLSLKKELLGLLPDNSVLTPHPKEWERLVGASPNQFAQQELVQEKAYEWKCTIVLKSHHTLIAAPNGTNHFNTTGNAGMAKGGSGDVLTGLISGFIAQGYSGPDAAKTGVFLHGMAGDLAKKKYTEEGMTATDQIRMLPDAWHQLKGE
jgi:NAD(P)H-hydrate epimerase